MPHRGVRTFGRIDLQIDKNAGFRFKDGGISIQGYDEGPVEEGIIGDLEVGGSSAWSGIVIARSDIDRLFRINDQLGGRKTIAMRQGTFGKPVSAGCVRLATREMVCILYCRFAMLEKSHW